MILIDMNQIMVSHIIGGLKDHARPDINSARRSIIRALHRVRCAFPTMGEIILCYDSRTYWRKELFPHYKANRKAERISSGVNWEEVHTVMNHIKDELRINMPYKTIEVEGAECDDIIAVLCRELHQAEEIIIVSQDKDFFQLQRYPGVRQYNISSGEFIVCDAPEKALREHIVRGDYSDGIPNVMSADDTFVTHKRQKTMSKDKINSLSELTPEEFGNYIRLRNWNRNFTLIDFINIPEQLAKEIRACYDKQAKNGFGKRQSTTAYLIQHNIEVL